MKHSKSLPPAHAFIRARDQLLSPAVMEAAVVPSPDPVRFAVPKAFVTLRPGCKPDAETAKSIFQHIRERLSPFKRVRRLEFGPLPNDLSGGPAE